MTTNDSTLIAALAEFAADLATDLQNLSAKAAAFSQRLQAVETAVQETKPKKASKKAEKAPKKAEKAPEPEPQPALTIEDVRAALAPVVKAGGSAQVRAALAAMGVSKLSDLAPERFSELLEAVNA